MAREFPGKLLVFVSLYMERKVVIDNDFFEHFKVI